jgi:signal transduction histidine kinase
MELLRSWRTELVLALLAVGTAVAFAIPHGAEALLITPLLLLVLAYRRRPLLAALGVVAVLVLESAAGVPEDNPGGLLALLVVAYGLGRYGGWRVSATMLVVWLVTVAAISSPEFRVGNVIFGTVVVVGPWVFGFLVGRRDEAASSAAAEADALAGLDPAARAAQVVAEERARLAAEVVRVVRTAVQAMEQHAADAEDLALTELEAVQDEGRRAVAELRRLLGLLRSDDPVPAPSEQGPGRRWRFDLALTVGLAVMLLLELRFFADPFLTASWLVGVALVAAVGLRRAEPVLACLLALVVVALADILDVAVPYAIVHLAVFALLAWSVAVSGRWRAYVALTALAAVVVLDVHRAVPGNVGINVGAFVLALVAGHLWAARDRQERSASTEAAALRREHEAIAAHAVQAERLRLARELHDVTSHAIGVMVLQAGAAQALRDDEPDRAREAVRTVQAAGIAAVRELDALAGLIHAGAVGVAGANEAAPEDDLAAALRSLVERMRTPHLQVSLSLEGRLPVGEDMAATVYRVVQEAVTNAARYAPESRVEVEVRGGDDLLEVEVHDDGAGAGPPASGAGFGLVGLAERVRGLGGELAAGPRPEGGFSVAARLPIGDAAEVGP